jgi:regulator of replication initiation timing
MTSVLHYREPIFYRVYDSMNTADYIASPHMSNQKQTSPYEGHSSGSESKRMSTPGAKRRPSRAGTRSVSTLTAAQLERKRANDREAQRAIRQRTKDHIETLQRQVADLTAQLEQNASPKLIELMRRNEGLEQENAVLRTRLSHAVAALGVSDQNQGKLHPSHCSLPSKLGSRIAFFSYVGSLLCFLCLGPQPF